MPGAWPRSFELLTRGIPALDVLAAPGPADRRVNDVHSQLNPTAVRQVVRVESVREVQEVVRSAGDAGLSVSIAGGRHAMGGQQFGAGTVLLDMTALCRVVHLDAERGLLTVEAGIDWPRVLTHLAWAGAGQPRQWAIVQKQTGADRLTIGGALSSNIHGRGLQLGPMIGDIESFELVDQTGALLTCTRQCNGELFSLAIGGYGLFGVIVGVTLRLTRRHKVQRCVTIATVDRLPELFERRIRDGFEYGDCQFATDSRSGEFMQMGVFSCYRPVEDDSLIPDDQRVLSQGEWQRLLLLAHTDKSQAFAEYARYYMSTDGQVYWSDTHQLASYIDGYHETLDRQLNAEVKGSEMITELYVPRPDLPAFVAAVRDDARQHDLNVIYGTIRVIEQDRESLLAWATQPWACVVFNLHVDHSPAGLRKAKSDFRRLIDAAAEFNGSYYLTYHRWATREQVERCHPRMREFLARKRALDPRAVFTSDWYTHHARLMAADFQEG
ncbi:MAG: FAD-binding oxidoreductase [Acidobacteriota bacterium]